MFLRATAKINLSLDVLRKREDGYHEVRMIMQMLKMYDRLTLTPVSGRASISLSTNLSYIPTDENNLVYKAAKLLMDETGLTDGVDIRLDKFIPVAAGLAGGSSDAAMTLVGMNRLFHLGLTERELMALGKKIGADVPFCIMGGTALSEGIGEILTPLPGMPDVSILLCKPPINVSTKEVYGALRANEITDHPDVDAMIEGLKNADLDAIIHPSSMKNVLEPVTKSLYPVIGKIEQEMLEAGAVQSMMSGSGPTVFGIFTDHEKAAECQNRLRKMRPQARTFLTAPDRKREGRF